MFLTNESDQLLVILYLIISKGYYYLSLFFPRNM